MGANVSPASQLRAVTMFSLLTYETKCYTFCDASSGVWRRTAVLSPNHTATWCTIWKCCVWGPRFELGLLVSPSFWEHRFTNYIYVNNKKLKVSHCAPRGAWEERRYGSYSFITSGLDGGEWSASRPGRALPLGKGLPVPIVQEAGWAPEPVCTQKLQEKFFAPAGDRNSIARSSSP
jgi:hypothetical protein